MAQEYNIPSGNNPNLQNPIYDEIDSIFQKIDVNGNQQRLSERVVNPVSERQLTIAKEIESARKLRLDSQFFTEKETVRNRFIGDISKMIFGRTMQSEKLESLTEDILKAEESSKVGVKIFGPLKPNEIRREFFYDGNHNGLLSWFYHEEKTDATRKVIGQVTLHYEAAHPVGTGVLRISSNPETKNALIDGKELADFITATEMYHEGVMSKIYSQTNMIQTDNLYQLHNKVHQAYDKENEDEDRLAA